MARPNIETVERIFDGWATGDFNVEVEAFDPHLVTVVGDDFPEFGVAHGLDGLQDYMRGFLAHFEHLTMEAENLQAAGDTVLVHVLQRGAGARSGIDGELRYFMLFTFRGGKIIRMDSVRHEHQALEAVGLTALE